MKKTVLVVEDFATIRDYVCETLNKKGYNTIGAINGNDAFSILTSKPSEIHLVLTDYYMPDCTGFELLQKIKSDPILSATPVIFLTTESDPDKIKEAKDAGLKAWIKKPYRSETFFAHIENAIL